MAPEMSAGVMIANISWNIENAAFGMVSWAPLAASDLSDSPIPSQPRPPQKPLPDWPKATEKPNSVQSTLTMPMVTNDIISMLRTLLARTMPP